MFLVFFIIFFLSFLNLQDYADVFRADYSVFVHVCICYAI